MGWKDCYPNKHPDGVTPEKALQEAMGAVDALVRAADKSKEFGIREHRAVGVLADLTAGLRTAGPCVEACLRLLEGIGKAYKQLGAPGDWGYGRPEGDALQWLYASTSLLNAASVASVVSATRPSTPAAEVG